ncbi:MAG: dTDP-4-dehydrorhamnose reductase [Verrucomicrobiota bacterium]|nr:dTDP-4-dehydrorhamnose reductase [Verrucomicrobiota bacterium]
MKIVVLGAGGRLGAALVKSFATKFNVAAFDHRQLDLADHAALEKTIGDCDFEVAINCAAMTNVDLCESQRERAFAINAEAPRRLAEICARKKAKLIHLSTDYVFDGEKRTPYDEEDAADPISVYGESKLAGEQNVLAADPSHLVVRVSWVFGPERASFIDGVIQRARSEDRVEAIDDKISAPTYTADLAEVLPRFFERTPSFSGLLHFSNDGACSWQEYAQHALDCCREAEVALRAHAVVPVPLASMGKFVARRPIYSVLSVEKVASLAGARPRPWRDAVRAYISDHIAKI